MYGFVLVCGWALTAAVIALVWVNSRPNRSLLVGLVLGVVAGVLWPITLWFAVGAELYRRASGGVGNTDAVNSASLDAQARQAGAFARQAEIENMPTSAQYWHAETQRLAAQGETAASSLARPASTGRIVIGCTVASIITLGVIAVSAPPVPTAATVTDRGTVAAPPRLEVPRPGSEVAAPERTRLGNIAKRYGETAGIGGKQEAQVVDFVVGEPRPAQCNPFAGAPQNGAFVMLPVSVKTYDDPDNRTFRTSRARYAPPPSGGS